MGAGPNEQLDNAMYENDRARCGTIVAVAVNLVYHLASLLHPFMPEASVQMLEQLNAPVRAHVFRGQKGLG